MKFLRILKSCETLIIAIAIVCQTCVVLVESTLDMTLGHMEFIADHLTEKECHHLVKELMRYDSEKDIPEIGCLPNLIKWDRTYGNGKTSQDMLIPLKKVGRDDLAEKLTKMVGEEMTFKFEHSPFWNGAPKAKQLAPGEKEVKEGETLQEMVEEYEKEVEEDNRGFIEKLTGFTGFQLFMIIFGAAFTLSICYAAFFSQIRCLNDIIRWFKLNTPVYCCGVLPKPIDRVDYDPEIHTLHSSFI